MSYLCENLVYETKNDYYLAYILKDDSYFYNSVYQMIKNDNEKCFVRPYKVNYNNAIEIVFLTENLVEIEKYVKRINLDDVMQVIENIFEKIIEINKAGFVKKETIDISDNHIYIDDEGNIRFVCVPISITSTIETQYSFDEMLKRKVMDYLTLSGKAGNSLINKFVQDCNDVSMSISDIYSALKDKKYIIYDLNEKENSQKLIKENVFGYYVLESTDRTKSDIIVNKTKAVMGKSEKEADFIIPESYISRQHCELIYSNDQIYIRDMGSTNGTFLNGIRVPSNEYMMVAYGDKITLSSTTYIVTGGRRT